jgi:hypothetical protein
MGRPFRGGRDRRRQGDALGVVERRLDRALPLTTEVLIAEELVAQPGAVIAPGFGDLAEGLARPSSPAGSPAP